MTQAVILAGGLGTRLRGAIPEGVPKPMAMVGGRPFLEHVLDQCLENGIDRVLLLLGFGADVVVNHFGDSYRGVPVAYSVEAQPLGTGGAIRAALSHLDDRFVLMNGDTYVRAGISEMLRLLGDGSLVMLLTEVEDGGRFGTAVTDGDRVVALREKGHIRGGLINAGVYAMTSELLHLLPEGSSSFERDLLESYLHQLRPRFVQCAGPFFDIGVPADYLAADEFFEDAGPQNNLATPR